VPGSPQPERLRFRERGRARRRLRYLREVRELQLRDAGGFLYDLYRFGVHRNALVRGKLEALVATDDEIRSLEDRLGITGRPGAIRRPGVGGRCASCGAFHSSESKFCARCGVELATAALAQAPAEPASAAPVEPVPVAEEPVTEVEPPEAEEPTAAEEPAAEELAPEEPAFEGDPDAGELTVARQEDPGANGTGPAEVEAEAPIEAEAPAGANGESADGEPAAESPEVDPDTGEVAAVGPSERPRARRGRARRRRGSDR
jgi:hypothetical protein